MSSSLPSMDEVPEAYGVRHEIFPFTAVISTAKVFDKATAAVGGECLGYEGIEPKVRYAWEKRIMRRPPHLRRSRFTKHLVSVCCALWRMLVTHLLAILVGTPAKMTLPLKPISFAADIHSSSSSRNLGRRSFQR